MNPKILSLLLACALMTPAVMFAADSGAIVGGGVGGAVGAAIGHDMNGRNGAIIGAAIGGATGAAIGTSHSRSQPQQQVIVKERVSYRDDDRYDHDRHDNGRHRGWHKGHGHHRQHHD